MSSLTAERLEYLAEDVARQEVEREEQEGHTVSECYENVTAEEASGQDEEEHHERQQTLQHGLFVRLWIARVRSSVLATWCLVTGSEYVVPREVQHK